MEPHPSRDSGKVGVLQGSGNGTPTEKGRPQWVALFDLTVLPEGLGRGVLPWLLPEVDQRVQHRVEILLSGEPGLTGHPWVALLLRPVHLAQQRDEVGQPL